MGSSYSIGPFPKELKTLLNLDLVIIRSKIFRYEKSIDRNYHDILYMSKKQLQWTFQLSEKLTFLLFQRFNEYNRVNIPSLELFSSLALCSCAEPKDKILFICSLLDLNRDGFISKSDVETLLICSTKGFSKIKNKNPPSYKLCLRIANNMFEQEYSQLNDHGEIAIKSIQVFLFIFNIFIK